jgi:hypothetical protein
MGVVADGVVARAATYPVAWRGSTAATRPATHGDDGDLGLSLKGPPEFARRIERQDR